VSEQGRTYAAYVEGEVKAERDRRSAFDARGLSLVTSSGSLATLLAALATVATAGGRLVLSGPVRTALIVSLLLFALAAACGIAANWNRSYAVAKPSTLDRMVNDRWAVDEVDARNYVASLNVVTVQTLRHGNNVKARLLSAGLVAQLAAVLAVSVTVALLVAGR
jgi:hypothetical protein